MYIFILFAVVFGTLDFSLVLFHGTRCSYHQAQPIGKCYLPVRYQIAKLSISMAHHCVSGGISGISILKSPFTRWDAVKSR
jgi:hypothetical protein